MSDRAYIGLVRYGSEHLRLDLTVGKGRFPSSDYSTAKFKRLTIEYRDLGIAAAGNQPPVLDP